ncbi:hypothetical protein PMAYCL1PPCAC_11193, partial [Pristionchus mayeri]
EIMKVAIVLLLTVSAVVALNCWDGPNTKGTDAKPQYDDRSCGEKVVACLRSDYQDDKGVSYAKKSCAAQDYKCPANDVPISGGLTKCCTTDHCNSASGSSLVMTVLAAGAAAFMRQ